MFGVSQGFMFAGPHDGAPRTDDFDWRLARTDPEKGKDNRRGKVGPTDFTEREKAIFEQLLAQLNDRNCFDFDYQPQQDDRLEVKVFSNKRFPTKFRWYPMRHNEGKWEIDKSNEFDQWRKRLEPFKWGKLRE